VFVAHDSNGVKVACAELKPLLALTSGPFSTLNAYKGDLVMSGVVKIEQSGSSSQLVTLHLEGADPACDGSQTGAGNKCGIHVHAGTSCGNPKGHFYDKGALSSDPWKPITYSSSSSGTAVASGLSVTTGLTLDDIADKVFVAHDSNGVKVACAELKATGFEGKPMHVTHLDKYPGYKGDVVVSGLVDVYQLGSSQILGYSFVGGDSRCTSYEKFSGNQCGIHIHSGKDCGNAGGHHFTGASDPWKAIRYVGLNPRGTTFAIQAELSEGEVLGRTVVVHDADAKRVACGVIQG